MTKIYIQIKLFETLILLLDFTWILIMVQIQFMSSFSEIFQYKLEDGLVHVDIFNMNQPSRPGRISPCKKKNNI